VLRQNYFVEKTAAQHQAVFLNKQIVPNVILS